MDPVVLEGKKTLLNFRSSSSFWYEISEISFPQAYIYQVTVSSLVSESNETAKVLIIQTPVPSDHHISVKATHPPMGKKIIQITSGLGHFVAL